LHEVTLLLWAYVQRVPLRISTVDLMKECILKNKEEIFSWDMTIILWGLSRFEGYDNKNIFLNLKEKCGELVAEMTPYELVTTIRVWCESRLGDQELYQKYVEQINEAINSIDLSETITFMYCLSIISKDHPKLSEKLLEKLKERALALSQQIQTSENNTDSKTDKKVSGEIDLSNLREYEANEEYEKFRNL